MNNTLTNSYTLGTLVAMLNSTLLLKSACCNMNDAQILFKTQNYCSNENNRLYLKLLRIMENLFKRTRIHRIPQPKIIAPESLITGGRTRPRQPAKKSTKTNVFLWSV